MKCYILILSKAAQLELFGAPVPGQVRAHTRKLPSGEVVRVEQHASGKPLGARAQDHTAAAQRHRKNVEDEFDRYGGEREAWHDLQEQAQLAHESAADAAERGDPSFEKKSVLADQATRDADAEPRPSRFNWWAHASGHAAAAERHAAIVAGLKARGEVRDAWHDKHDEACAAHREAAAAARQASADFEALSDKANALTREADAFPPPGTHAATLLKHAQEREAKAAALRAAGDTENEAHFYDKDAAVRRDLSKKLHEDYSYAHNRERGHLAAADEHRSKMTSWERRRELGAPDIAHAHQQAEQRHRDAADRWRDVIAHRDFGAHSPEHETEEARKLSEAAMAMEAHPSASSRPNDSMLLDRRKAKPRGTKILARRGYSDTGGIDSFMDYDVEHNGKVYPVSVSHDHVKDRWDLSAETLPETHLAAVSKHVMQHVAQEYQMHNERIARAHGRPAPRAHEIKPLKWRSLASKGKTHWLEDL